jgi:hypothetical protein
MAKDNERTKRIAELNDAFRKGERPELGRLMITSGVRELARAWPLGEIAVYQAVQQFEDFSEDNDPHGERDFGSFEFAGEKVFWKIDYYNKALDGGSEDPADPAQTTRVLTIMLAQEY